MIIVFPVIILFTFVRSSSGFASRRGCTRRKLMYTNIHYTNIHPHNTISEDHQKVRVLVLHGKGSNGINYRKLLSPLEQALEKRASNMNLNFVFDYLTAPFLMENTTDRMQWWLLPPGVRSFEASEYTGFQKSCSLVEEAMTISTKYDLIIGHSQGAILTSILMVTSPLFFPGHSYKPKLCILNGVAWPNPFQQLLLEYKVSQDTSSRNTKALFIIGRNDSVNPPDGAERVRNLFSDARKVDVDSIYHDGGHPFPTNDPQAMEEILKWILENI